MFKVIAKTAITVIFGIAVLLVLAYGVLSLGFPKIMAEYFEKRENYSMAAGYASLQYTYSGEAADVARCVQDYILAEDNKKTAVFGDKLIAHAGFDELCESETQRLGIDYRQYICGKIAVAKYANGDKEDAVNTAKAAVEANGEFVKNNALVTLTLEVAANKDIETAEIIKSYVEESGYDGEYAIAISAALEKIING